MAGCIDGLDDIVVVLARDDAIDREGRVVDRLILGGIHLGIAVGLIDPIDIEEVVVGILYLAPADVEALTRIIGVAVERRHLDIRIDLIDAEVVHIDVAKSLTLLLRVEDIEQTIGASILEHQGVGLPLAADAIDLRTAEYTP